MTRPAAWLLAGLLAAPAGCASFAAGRARDAYVARQLDELRYAKPIDEVWLEVRRLLAEKGYLLAGEDAKAVGQDRGFLGRLFSAAVETRGEGPDRRYLETDWGERRDRRLRYRADGSSEGEGCRVVITAISQSAAEPSEDSRYRDRAMELDLVRRVDPEAAARIEAGAEAAAAPR